MNKTEEQIIKETQDMAKKLGHCLCNLKLQCPCEDFIKNNLCPCSDHKIQTLRNKSKNSDVGSMSLT